MTEGSENSGAVEALDINVASMVSGIVACLDEHAPITESGVRYPRARIVALAINVARELESLGDDVDSFRAEFDRSVTDMIAAYASCRRALAASDTAQIG